MSCPQAQFFWSKFGHWWRCNLLFSELEFLAEKFFGKQFCEKNWLYALLKPCFVQKIRQNSQKVKFETLLKFSKNYIFFAQNIEKADIFDLEKPIEWLNTVESRISHHFANLTKIQPSLNPHFLAILTNLLDIT